MFGRRQQQQQQQHKTVAGLPCVTTAWAGENLVQSGHVVIKNQEITL
jgi:hypothetical protein